jgi:hypothetical protein
MQKVISYYIYAEDCKQLIENGKECGVFVIASENKDLSVFENVKEIVKHTEYIADEGMIFRNKETGEEKNVIDESELELYNEVKNEFNSRK